MMFPKHVVTAVLAFSGVAGMGWVSPQIASEVKGKQKSVGLNAHETHASASLLGQFRTSASSYLWLRTDLYVHNGVEMRPLSDAEVKSGQSGVGGDEHGEEGMHDDYSIVTSVPSKDRDFRGVFGDVERATATYKDMTNHTHNDPKASLPLFRLMTWIDPSFIQGWTTGSMVMARDRTDEANDKAIAFIDEGLSKNPQDMELLKTRGYLMVTRNGDLAGATQYLQKAIEAGLPYLEHFDEIELENLDNSYRWLALCYRDLGEFEKQVETAQAGLEIFEDDAVLHKLAYPEPSIALSSEDDVAVVEDEKCDHGDDCKHEHH